MTLSVSSEGARAQEVARRIGPRGAHDAATRMYCGAAHPEPGNRGAIPRPFGRRAEEEELLEAQFSLENVAFAQPGLLLDVPRGENLAVKDRLFQSRTVLGKGVDDGVPPRLALRGPGRRTFLDVIRGVLDEDGHDVLAGRSHGRV